MSTPPLETVWVPVQGDNYLHVYCLWGTGGFKGKGRGRQLMAYCLTDTRARGKSGGCMLGAEKQKAWLSGQAFAEKYGFETVEITPDGYRLLALSFQNGNSRFPSFHLKMTRRARVCIEQLEATLSEGSGE